MEMIFEKEDKRSFEFELKRRRCRREEDGRSAKKDLKRCGAKLMDG